MDPLLSRVDEYLHAVPLAEADAEEVGPFTLFRSRKPWPYYARPRPGAHAEVTAADVAAVADRCRELEIPLSLEWVVETAPSVGPAAVAAGLPVVVHPLLVVSEPELREVPRASALQMRILPADAGELGTARAVAEVGFGAPGTAVGQGGAAERDAAARRFPADRASALVERAREGTAVTAAVGAGAAGFVATGEYKPVGPTAEIVGVATLPAYRRRGLAAVLTWLLARDAFSRGVDLVLLSADDDAVARVYERVGFRRIGTAAVAEPPA